MKVKNGFLISALVLSVLWFGFLMLTLFKVIDISAILAPSFNYLLAFASIVCCLGLYTLALFIENRNFLNVPVWISCCFYVAFFLFTNVYYLFDLYNIIWTNLLFYVCLSVLVSILSISIYYNCLKENDGTLKNKIGFTGFMLFCISITISVIFELVVMFIKFCLNTTINLTSHTLASFGILVLGATIFAIIFHHSIKGNKKFANACLIKVKPVNLQSSEPSNADPSSPKTETKKSNKTK